MAAPPLRLVLAVLWSASVSWAAAQQQDQENSNRQQHDQEASNRQQHDQEASNRQQHGHRQQRDQESSSLNDTLARCRDRSYLDNCLKKLPPILEKHDMNGIPSSKADVDASCSAFKTGMGCMDRYAGVCLSRSDRQTLEAHVAGARHTFKFLCDDPVFQAEYLQYTSCYRGISKDWDACANRFVSLVREEVARKNHTMETRLLELCCARHGFLKCVYVASRLKCKREEALFIKKIADTLSNMRVYSKHCRNVDVEVCGDAGRCRGGRWTLVALLWTLLAAAHYPTIDRFGDRLVLVDSHTIDNYGYR